MIDIRGGICALLTLAAALLATPVPAAPSAEFKGFRSIESTLALRIGDKGQIPRFKNYFPSEGLLALLGTWDRPIGIHTFRNGQPNPVNMLIWHAGLDAFAADLSVRCNSTNNIQLDARVALVIDKLCAWPQAPARDDALLLEYWTYLMGYDAPEEEYVAWKDFFLGPAFLGKSGKEVVKAMSLAILLNPYFLLQN